eukprot:GHVU01114479.1.p1 GENE.GHVU01114479.1~~GHVU01114479.1.p1  ORF type:complete len:296 (-),score=2.28 GHVU01114479.1:42-866(-)
MSPFSRIFQMFKKRVHRQPEPTINSSIDSLIDSPTNPPTDFSDSLTPRVPVEIIQLIIQEAWALPLSTSERAQFMKSSLLVNSGWMKMFVRESLTDVHLPSLTYASRYRDIADGKSLAYSTIVRVDGDTARNLCRSITIHCMDPLEIPVAEMHPMVGSAHTVAELLYLGAFPNFNGKISVQVPRNVPIPLFEYMRLSFPSGLKVEDFKRKIPSPTNPAYWSLELSGVRESHAISLYEHLVSFANLVKVNSFEYALTLGLQSLKKQELSKLILSL